MLRPNLEMFMVHVISIMTFVWPIDICKIPMYFIFNRIRMEKFGWPFDNILGVHLRVSGNMQMQTKCTPITILVQSKYK